MRCNLFKRREQWRGQIFIWLITISSAIKPYIKSVKRQTHIIKKNCKPKTKTAGW